MPGYERMTPDLRDPPIVVSQPRAMMLIAIIPGLFILAMGMTVQPNHWMIDGSIPVEWLLIPGGAITAGAGLVGFIRPGRLTLSPAGLEFRQLLSTRRAPWNAIQVAGIYTYRGLQAVSVRFYAGQSLQLAAGWPLEARALANLINQARSEWTTAPARRPRMPDERTIPPRWFREEEVLAARDYLRQHHSGDWATLCASEASPFDEQAASDLGLRLIRGLIKGGFVDNLAHGSSLFLSLIKLARGYPPPY